MFIIILENIIGWIMTIAITSFVIISIVVFIKDGKSAKKENRDRNKNYTVMFIVSMIIIGLLVVVGILLGILAMLVMRSM
jgi:hypothetical protein